MKLRGGSFVIALSCFLGAEMGDGLYGREAVEAEEKSAQMPAPIENREMLDLVRRTQELAEQSQEELRRSREQNEHLQQLLEQTHQELTRLREEMDQLRSCLPAFRAVPSAAVGEGKGQRTGGESGRTENPADTDDLATRLTRVEDQVELNTAQIREQAQTKVESDSRFKVRLFGTVLNNTYFNSADGSEEAVPTAVPQRAATAVSGGHNWGATLRQTRIGLSMTGPKLGEARLRADAEFDFFGAAGNGYNRNVLGTLRMRTASARLEGLNTSLALGLISPMVSPLNPDSLAAVSYPALGESGNLWQWLPQMIVEHRKPIREDSELILQGGLMMPFGETINNVGLAGRPGYESRIAFARRQDSDSRLEIGVGGYFHPQPLGFGRKVNSYAATSDWRIPLTRVLELSGEAFYGQSVPFGEQSGGDIAAAFSLSGPLNNPGTVVGGIHSAGGWAQLKAKASAKLDFNFAFGIDDPRNRDVFARLFDATARLRNQTFSINSIYRFRSNFLVSAEYRRLWTTYPGAQTVNDHINLAVGYVF